MSFRYAAGINKPGFNPLAAPTGTTSYYLYSMGLNNSGQLGLGNTTYYSSPKQVGSLGTWVSLSSGGSSSGGIDTNGRLWMWGVNSYGQLGLGNTTSYSSPKQVGTLTWSKISVATNASAMAIRSDGTLWGWGRNNNAQLGLNNITNYSSPKQVGALTTWLQIAAGYYGSAAIKTDGTLWVWGFDNYGNLGLGVSGIVYSSPKQVGALTNWSMVTQVGQKTHAIKTDGTLWSWGRGSLGGLGLGNETYYSSPKQVGSLTTWSFVAAGLLRCLATKTDGTLWAWGYNNEGALGLNNLTNYSSPKQVGALTNWSKVYGQTDNTYRTMAAKTNGTLWGWGNNTYGPLGLGNTTTYSSPKQVGAETDWGQGVNTIAMGQNFSLASRV